MAEPNGKGTYTTEFTAKLNRDDAKTMAERFLGHAHPTEVALAQSELNLFTDMSEKEKLSYVVRLNRGSNTDLLITLAAAAGFFGAGKVAQTWFPYTFAGSVPTLPTVVGVAGMVTGFAIKRRMSFRLPLVMASLGFALGGGSISGIKI